MRDAVLAALPAEGASRAQIAQAIRATGVLVLRALTMALDLTRREARASAAEQVDDELAMVSAEAGEQIAPAPPPDNRQEDAISAESAAGAYASAWQAMALLALVAWARSDGRGGSIQAAIAKVTTTIEYRVKRIVATEAARARNDEHRERWRGIVKAHPRASWGKSVFRRWDARLDKRVCAVCRGHESEECPIDGQFRGGDEPGDIHPSCRCIATTIVLDGSTVLGVNDVSPAPYVESASGKTGKRAA